MTYENHDPFHPELEYLKRYHEDTEPDGTWPLFTGRAVGEYHFQKV
jgi:hypothetical protein